MEFEFDTTTRNFERDADQSLLLNRAVDQSGMPFRLMVIASSAVAIVLTLITANYLLAGNWDMGLLFACMLATVAGVLAWSLTGWSVKSEAKSARRARAKAAAPNRRIVLKLNDEGCFCTVDGIQKPDRLFAWEDLAVISESEDLFFLGGRKIPGVCIRKESQVAGTEAELRTFLQSKSQKPIKKYEINQEKLQNMLK